MGDCAQINVMKGYKRRIKTAEPNSYTSDFLKTGSDQVPLSRSLGDSYIIKAS